MLVGLIFKNLQVHYKVSELKKGIFITTSNYSSEARDYVKNVDAKIILIDGRQLVELMWEFNVGLSVFASYEIKKLDLDYFSE